MKKKTLPEVGKNAAIYIYGNMQIYQVSRMDNAKVWIKPCMLKEVDKNEPLSSIQEYSITSENEEEIMFVNNYWRRVNREIVYINPLEVHSSSHVNEYGELLFIDGITTIESTYPKINIVFGFQQEYSNYVK